MIHTVSGFGRSLSVPTDPNNRPTGRQHIRSISLPCRFHPIVFQLNRDLQALRAWLQSSSTGNLINGLTQLDQLHASLDKLLHLPHAFDTLRRLAASWTDRLLKDFLHLADAYHTFRSAIISLRQHQSSTHAAIRRRDHARIVSCIRAQRRAEQELSRLASSVRETSKITVTIRMVQSIDASLAELVGIMLETIAVTSSASSIVFSAIAAASSLAVSALSKKGVVGPLFGRRIGREEDENCRLEKLKELMDCMIVFEEKSEGVFRSLINTRVSLLNILSPSL